MVPWHYVTQLCCWFVDWGHWWCVSSWKRCSLKQTKPHYLFAAEQQRAISCFSARLGSQQGAAAVGSPALEERVGLEAEILLAMQLWRKPGAADFYGCE